MSAPNGLTLWGMGTVRQLRPHWMLAELGLDYEYFPVHPRSGETTMPDFLRINPRHKVPVLRHGDFILTESAAIVHYLAEAFEAPDYLYLPQDPAGRARVNEWNYFIMSEIDGHALYVIRRHDDLKVLYGDAPRAVEAARAYFADQFNAMAPRVGAVGRYLFGDRLSVADILLVTTIDWAIDYRMPLPQNVLDYHARVIRRPAYQAARAKTFPKA
jgi:glutathione S-transferase